MSTCPHAALLKLENFASGTPHAEIARLRREHRVVWQEIRQEAWQENEVDVDGYWLVLQQPEIDHVLRTPADFTSNYGPLLEDMPAELLSGQQESMTFMDPPRHRTYRSLVKHAFQPKTLKARLPVMREMATEIIDSVIDAGECEFIAEVALQLPMRVMFRLLGVRAEDYERVADLTTTLTLASDPEFAENRAAGFTASLQLIDYGEGLAADHRRDPRDSMTMDLLESELEGRQLTDREFGGFFNNLIVGGMETTRNTLGWLVYEFTRHPDQYARLQADLSLVPNAVEEILRLRNTVVYLRRTATRDLELAGAAIRKSDKVVCVLGGPNRDAAVFPDPDRFDIGRDPSLTRRNYRTFGGGPHFCIGVHQARMNLEVMTAEIAHRMSNLRLVSPPVHFKSNFMDGFKRMRLAFDGAS